jgi:hypothetical protein
MQYINIDNGPALFSVITQPTFVIPYLRYGQQMGPIFKGQ